MCTGTSRRVDTGSATHAASLEARQDKPPAAKYLVDGAQTTNIISALVPFAVSESPCLLPFVSFDIAAISHHRPLTHRPSRTSSTNLSAWRAPLRVLCVRDRGENTRRDRGKTDNERFCQLVSCFTQTAFVKRGLLSGPGTVGVYIRYPQWLQSASSMDDNFSVANAFEP